MRRSTGVVVADQRGNKQIIVENQRPRAGAETPVARCEHRLVVAVVTFAHEQIRHVFDGILGVLEIDRLIDLLRGDAPGFLRQLESRHHWRRSVGRIHAATIDTWRDGRLGWLLRRGNRLGRATPHHSDAFTWLFGIALGDNLGRRLHRHRRQRVIVALGVSRVERRKQRYFHSERACTPEGTYLRHLTFPTPALSRPAKNHTHDGAKAAPPLQGNRGQEMEGGARA